jgi:hypothetical protein
MKFEIHFEFRASLRKFQDLNFWDATPLGESCHKSYPSRLRRARARRAWLPRGGGALDGTKMCPSSRSVRDRALARRSSGKTPDGDLGRGGIPDSLTLGTYLDGVLRGLSAF